MAIPRGKYTSDALIAAFYTRIVDHVSSIPGVMSAAMVNRVPLSGNNLTLNVEFDGGALRSIQWRSATPEYFSTIGIPLRDGRTFSERDAASAPLAGIIDERLARSLWPDQRAVGRRFRVTFPGQAPTDGEVVGVVGNVRHQGLDSQEDRQIYFNYRQFTDGRMALVVRTSGDAGAMTAAVLQAIRTLDAEQPVYDVSVMTDVLARSTAPRWFNLAIVATFAISSLVLASVGLYGVMAFGVTERAREFGVRLALGASPSDVARLVVRQGAILVGCGVVPGLAAALALTRGMRGLVYGISPLDPVSFAAAAIVLFGVALAASYVPARRAALSDPTHALRGD
jgi:predicted permease